MMKPSLQALDAMDWSTIEAPVSMPRDREADKPLQVKVFRSGNGYFCVKLVKEWKEMAGTTLLSHVVCHPLTTPAAIIVAPCIPDTPGVLQLGPRNGGFNVYLKNALKEYQLPWPKNHKLVLPALLKPTKYGFSVILDVAGHEFEEITHRTTDTSNQTNKKKGEDPGSK